MTSNKNINMAYQQLPYLVVGILCPFFMLGQGQQIREDAPPPNILWIVSEDNSPLLGCYGDDFATTPFLDEFAKESILYENAFATAPVCAPARSTLITGMYPTSMGTQHMRSNNAIPDAIKFFPTYMRKAGYYCTNNAKEDYNTTERKDVWDESSKNAHYKDRKDGQPFFAVFNLGVSHESALHKPLDSPEHNPEDVPIPPYHPRTPEMEHDWAQYYDVMESMDSKVGNLLEELNRNGLADNTIVFYYSDHGGVLGRSKRFLYESGLHVPLIIRFPEKYRHLAPDNPGSRTDRIVSFVDFAPTVLSLADITIPDYIQGKAFLGKQEQSPRDYAYSFRGRMDEVYDMSRSVRDKKYRYTANYMPHRIYGQYLGYLWRAPSIRSWQQACENGKCTAAQTAFWETKPPEELYDIVNDPHNINNLANDEKYGDVLSRMRKANFQWMKKSKDTGFIPEAEMIARAEKKGITIYELMQRKELPMDKIIETAQMASLGQAENLPEIMNRLEDSESTVRYWAATGCAILGEQALPAKDKLTELLHDPSPNVAIAAAEALYNLGEKKKCVAALERALDNDQLMVRVHALNILLLQGEDARPASGKVKLLLIGKDDKDRSYDLRAARHFIRNMEID